MTKNSVFALLACLSVTFISTRVFSNDSTAELAAGGLVFTKSDDIEMSSEDLFVSLKEIKVRYHFLNQSDKAVVTQIAFPMPDIPYGVDDFNFAIQSRPRKFEQVDKWSFCLTPAIIAANRRDHEQTTAPEPLTGLQGEGGACRRQGRPDDSSTGRAV